MKRGNIIHSASLGLTETNVAADLHQFIDPRLQLNDGPLSCVQCLAQNSVLVSLFSQQLHSTVRCHVT